MQTLNHKEFIKACRFYMGHTQIIRMCLNMNKYVCLDITDFCQAWSHMHAYRAIAGEILLLI